MGVAGQAVVDCVFGGHDHFYRSSFTNDVLLLKSGTDFECFTDVTALFDVEKEDYLKFKEKIAEARDSENRTELQKSNDMLIEYSEKLKRMFIAERVYITDVF